MEEKIELENELPPSDNRDSQSHKIITSFDILEVIFSRKTAPHAAL